MAKKKAKDTEDEFEELKDDIIQPPEEPLDEDEENEDTDPDNALLEDEDDRQMIAKLEAEDRELSEKIFAFDEELGFNPLYDWDSVPEKDVDDAKTWLAMDAEKLAAIKFSKSDSQLKKWIIACACKKNALHDNFREITLALMGAKKRDPRLSFADIYLALLDDYAQTGEFDKAFETIETIRKDKAVSIDEHTLSRVKALILFKKGDISEGKMIVDEIAYRPFNKSIQGFETDRVTPNTELVFFEIALSLFSLDLYDLGMEYLEKSRKLAILNNNNDLILEICNAKSGEEKLHNAKAEEA